MGNAESENSGDIDFAALVADHQRETDEKKSAKKANGTSARKSDAQRDSSSASEKSSGRFWSFWFPASVIGAVVLLPLLVWFGFRTILQSTDGDLVKRVTDPAAPGYEAAVDYTPTNIVYQLDADGQVTSTFIDAQTSQTSTGLLFLPPGLMVKTEFGDYPIWNLYQLVGADVTSSNLSGVVKLGFQESTVLTAAELTAVQQPFGSLTFTIPDPVRSASGAQLFAQGTVTVSPQQAPTFLSARGPREPEVNRMLRQEQYWKAFAAAYKKAPQLLNVPVDRGIGRVIATFNVAQLSVESIPVMAAQSFPNQPPRFVANEDGTARVVANIVPFPDGGGSRPRLRVLDGTGQLNNGVDVALLLAANGGQIAKIGNAKSFGIAETEVVYYDGTSEETAQKFLDVLGVGKLSKSDKSNAAGDIVVILGEDYLRK